MSEVTGFPSGLAVTQDGRWLISLGFRKGTVTLRDAETLEPLAGPLSAIPCSIELCGRDTVVPGHPHAVSISPDGSLAVLTSRGGLIGLDLPSLDIRFNPVIPEIGAPRHVVRDETGESYYVSGEQSGIARLNSSGELKAFFDSQKITALSLTRDEEKLLAITDGGMRLVILDIPELNLVRSIDLQFEGQVVVSLREQDKAIVVGGEPSGAETSVNMPLMYLSVNLTAVSEESPQILLEGSGGALAFGDGNEWTDVGQRTAVVPTLVGTVTIDTNDGAVALHPAAALGRELPPCCDIASYPNGRQVIIAAADFVSTGGSLVIYEIEE